MLPRRIRRPSPEPVLQPRLHRPPPPARPPPPHARRSPVGDRCNRHGFDAGGVAGTGDGHGHGHGHGDEVVGLGRRAATQVDMAVLPLGPDRRMQLQRQRPWRRLRRDDLPGQQRQVPPAGAAGCADESAEQGQPPGDEAVLCSVSQSLADSRGHTVRKGLLWQQRDRLFSRWRQRFFVLTTDYLQCFSRASSSSSSSSSGSGGSGSSSGLSQMGSFLCRLRLAEVESVELVDRRGYPTVVLDLEGGKMLLRRTEGIREWFIDIKECVRKLHLRRGRMESTKEFWSRKQLTDASAMERYLLARRTIEMKYAYNSDGVSYVSNSAFAGASASAASAVLTKAASRTDKRDVFQAAGCEITDSPLQTRVLSMEQRLDPAPSNAGGGRMASWSHNCIYSGPSSSSSSSSSSSAGRNGSPFSQDSGVHSTGNDTTERTIKMIRSRIPMLARQGPMITRAAAEETGQQ